MKSTSFSHKHHETRAPRFFTTLHKLYTLLQFFVFTFVLCFFLALFLQHKLTFAMIFSKPVGILISSCLLIVYARAKTGERSLTLAQKILLPLPLLAALAVFAAGVFIPGFFTVLLALLMDAS